MSTLQAEEDGNDEGQVYADVKNAIDFMQTFRGRYIIGQALFYAIKELESVEEGYQEKSNIDDMKYLKDELFNFPDEMYASQSVKESD